MRVLIYTSVTVQLSILFPAILLHHCLAQQISYNEHFQNATSIPSTFYDIKQDMSTISMYLDEATLELLRKQAALTNAKDQDITILYRCNMENGPQCGPFQRYYSHSKLTYKEIGKYQARDPEEFLTQLKSRLAEKKA